MWVDDTAGSTATKRANADGIVTPSRSLTGWVFFIGGGMEGMDGIHWESRESPQL